MENLNIETIIATGANDMATGSRLAMRGLIWFAYGFHLECNIGDEKPANYKRKVNAALLTLGRGKGEASTKSTQANVIGDAFPKLFTAQLVTEYATVSDLIAACFNEAEANGAGAVSRLVDWAKHGDADHTAKVKEQKKAEREAEKQEALDMIQNAADSAVAVAQPDLGFVPAVVEVQNLNPEAVDAETKENTIAKMVSEMSDADLDQLAQLVAKERAERKADIANVA